MAGHSRCCHLTRRPPRHRSEARRRASRRDPAASSSSVAATSTPGAARMDGIFVSLPLDDAEPTFGWQIDRRGDRRPRKPTAPRAPCRSRGSSRSCSPATSSLRATRGRTRSCLQLGPGARSASGTSPGRCGRRSRPRPMRMVDLPSRSFMSSTQPASRSGCRRGRCRRCIRSAHRGVTGPSGRREHRRGGVPARPPRRDGDAHRLRPRDRGR